MKLLAFDLDGTLTQHKTIIEPENRALIASLSRNYRIVLVGAGSCTRIASQLDGLLLPIIGHYGMQQSLYDCQGNLCLCANDTVPVNQPEALARVLRLREQFNLLDFCGEPLEVHASGMLTFPILGTCAALSEKLAYDPTRIKRRAMYTCVCAAFPEYHVVIGGTSSFDIIPKPYSKYHALSRYAHSLAISHNDVTYFGDDYGTGGNDESIAQSDISFIPVDDYRALKTVVAPFLTCGGEAE